MKNLLEDAMQITCVLPKGKAAPLRKLLHEERGLQDTHFHRARGVGRFTPLSGRDEVGGTREKEILEVIVPASEADELMEYMFFEGDMNHAHGGVIYMVRIPRATQMELPDLPWHS